MTPRPNRTPRRRRGASPLLALFLLPAFGVAVAPTGGCGRSAPVIRVDDAITLTEDTLTEALLGPGERSATDPTRVDPPLLQKGTYETVLIAADRASFARVTKGALNERSIREIEDRVTRAVHKRVAKRGFAAKQTAYPPAAEVAQSEKTLLATLVPTIQEAGSPQDKAAGRGRELVLVRLTITDPRTGAILAARDYYSGQDVPQGKEKDKDRR